MNAKHFLLVLALLAPSLTYAQGAPQDKVQGRNSWLKERLTPLAGSVRHHVVKLSGGKSGGYGVVIKPGFVLTSDNLIGSSRSMRGTDSKGKTHALTVHARQRKHGVAVLRFNASQGSPQPIKLGASGSLAIGQIVAAIGTGPDPIAAGVVSALKRPVYPDGRSGGGNVFLKMFSDGSNQGHTRAYPRVIQHDGPLEAEHFGSPLVNRKGELVGINVAYPYRGSAHAVGVDTFGKALGDLLAGKSTDAPAVTPKRPKRPRPDRQPASGPRPFLGAGVAPATPTQLGKGHAFGLYIREVKEGGPAAKSGLTAGDVIVAMDGQPFASMDVFAKRMRAKSPGDTMKLKVLKGAAGIETELSVVLGKR
jgi:S1-C subfamily serine protease